MTITKEEILHLAKLGKLKLNDEELTKLESNLADIVNYFEILKELDLGETDTTSQVNKLSNIYFEDKENSKNLFGENISEECLKCSNQKVEMKQIKVPNVL